MESTSFWHALNAKSSRSNSRKLRADYLFLLTANKPTAFSILRHAPKLLSLIIEMFYQTESVRNLVSTSFIWVYFIYFIAS